MAVLTKGIILVAVLGGFALWIYGAVAFVRTLTAIRASEENAGMTRAVVFNWFFASRRLKGEAAMHAAHVNKAVYGFVICVVVAAAAAIFTAVPSEPVR